MQRLLFILFFVSSLQYCVAQSNHLSKAERYYAKAQTFLLQKKTTKASKYLFKAIEADRNYTKAYSTLGTLYCNNLEYDKAIDIFKKATNSCKNCSADFAFPLANALFQAKQYSQAKSILKNIDKSNFKNSQTLLQINKLLADIDYSIYAQTHYWDSIPHNLGLRVNTEFDEYFPSISPNDSILYFTRRTGGIDEDFYIARKDSCDGGAWLTAKDLGSPPNSSQQEGAQFISADGHYLFFQRCGNRSDNGWTGGGCDLYISYTDSTSKHWVQPEPFGYTINTTRYEGMPSLSSDNKELFFVSDRDSGFGGKDIWVSEFKNGLWQIPKNLGSNINTPNDETAPYIAPDNTTLYFTSNGLPGLGGNDIYMSKRNTDSTWSKPVNIGAPINSQYNEVSFCISADGSKGYFASDRPGGLGGMDLYDVALPQALRPVPYTYVTGYTYDSITKARITYTQIEWSDATTSNLLFKYQSNRGDGSFMAAIPINKKFIVKAYRTGYNPFTDTLIYTKINTAIPDTLNIPLLSMDYHAPQEIVPQKDNIIFVFNYDKNVSSISSINRQALIDTIKTLQQKNITFYVNGYTDDSGNPTINEYISNLRAANVGKILEDMGIEPNHIIIQGWADANPVAPNDTETNRRLNRRVEVIIKQ